MNLSSLQISTASHLSASLYGTQSKHIKISLLLELLFVIRYLESVGDNSNTFGTIKRGIGNLCLERQGIYLGHIKISHLEQFFYLFHAILKSDFGLLIHITQFTCEDSFVFT